jgi:Putative transmembrane protein (PGPGW)
MESKQVMSRESTDATIALTFSVVMRRIIIGLSGGLVLIVGVAMTVLPGPAIVVVPLGLTILATEFAWARRMMHRFRDMSDRVVAKVKPRASATPGTAVSLNDGVSSPRLSSAAGQRRHRQT